MFLNDLFSITDFKSGSETISAAIQIDADHKIFDGHFPGSPVLPGVVQLQIVKEILESFFKRELSVKTMKTSKFLQIVNPREMPLVHFELKFVQKEFLDVIATGTKDETVFFKAQVSYL